ncbi:Misato segment II tubulin-like domain-containing protein [Sparassis latifolia]
MKEVLYVQAGSFANYIGTHFWNTQESYFTYGLDKESDVDHDVSFREGVTLQGEATFCPRLLLFDRKANFGNVSATSGLYGYDEDETDDAPAPLWSSTVAEYRQTRIPPSTYHAQLDAEAADAGEQAANRRENEAQKHEPQPPRVVPSDVRYWSDYSRVFFHPRTIQKLPDRAEWEDAEGDWGASREAFGRYDAGIQVMHDTATFGGFTDSLLTVIRDDFPKLPCLAFPLLSGATPGSFDVEDALSFRRAINDALCLRSLDSLSTLTVPIQSPSTWAPGDWLGGINLNRTSLYHTSAIVSAHIESATLPVRLKGSMDDLSSMCERFSLGGGVRFAHLSGVFPFSSSLVPTRDFDIRTYDFSVSPSNGTGTLDKYAAQDPTEFTKIYVSRGFSGIERRQFDQWAEQRRPVPYSIHSPAYPLPSSFPRFFTPPPPTPPPSMRTLAALSSTTRTAHLFASHAALVTLGAARHADVLAGMGLELDEVRELRDALWMLCDACAGGEERDVEMGEDEE